MDKITIYKYKNRYRFSLGQYSDCSKEDITEVWGEGKMRTISFLRHLYGNYSLQILAAIRCSQLNEYS